MSHLDIKDGQAGALTRARYAFTGGNVETGAMVRANEVTVVSQQEPVGRPVQGATLVGANVQVGADIVARPEKGNIDALAGNHGGYFLSDIRIDFIQAAQALQFDSPGERPHVIMINVDQ